MRVLLVSANRERRPAPVVPLGLLYVAAAVRPGHEVRLVDVCFEADPAAAVAAAIADFAPAVVGVGIRNLASHRWTAADDVRELVAAVRGATAAPLVLGGAGFSLRARTLVDELGADHGVVGAARPLGERPPRLLFADDAGGDLDALALPARDLVDPRHRTDGDGGQGVQSKRGCAFTCAYCHYPDLEGRRVRVRDPEAVADEVASLASRGVAYAFFVDSVFNAPRAHALAVCDALARRGAPLPWVCYATPRDLDGGLAAAMARAGCIGVELGTDVGTDEMLARLRKPFTTRDVERAHAALVAHGIADCHSFILGACGETAAEAARTLDFAERLDPDVAVFITFREEREGRVTTSPPDRRALLDLLGERAPRAPGWIVPELEVRSSDALLERLRTLGRRGPAWLHLARARRGRHQA